MGYRNNSSFLPKMFIITVIMYVNTFVTYDVTIIKIKDKKILKLKIKNSMPMHGLNCSI